MGRYLLGLLLSVLFLISLHSTSFARNEEIIIGILPLAVLPWLYAENEYKKKIKNIENDKDEERQEERLMLLKWSCEYALSSGDAVVCKKCVEIVEEETCLMDNDCTWNMEPKICFFNY